MAPGFDPKNPKRGHWRRAQECICGCIRGGIEQCAVGKSQIVSTGEGHHTADIHRGVQTNESGRVHEKQVGVPEACGLNGPEDVRDIPPVTRPRMLDVARPESFRKFAMLWLGTLKSPKLWNRLVPPPGRVPPVMSYCTCPAGGVTRVTCVFNPDGVIGDVSANALPTAYHTMNSHTNWSNRRVATIG